MSGPENGAAKPAAADAAAAGAVPPKATWKENPALRALGITRLRLPSRNWSIFLGTVFTIGGMVYYDRHERRANRQKWKDAVSSLALQPLTPMQLPRKVTVYVAPPPGDYLDISVDHFTQYVKPVLTAAAVEFDLVKGTRQGEIRNAVAEAIRKQRAGVDDRDPMLQTVTAHLEKRAPEDEGVVCIGRGAYKEYLQGVNEGWLGPLEAPPAPIEEVAVETVEAAAPAEPVASETVVAAAAAAAEPAELVAPAVETVDDVAKAAATSGPGMLNTAALLGGKSEVQPAEAAPEEPKKKEEKPPVPKPYIAPGDYAAAATPTELARVQALPPVVYVPHPHILGVVHTPVRTYRYFTQRRLADRVGHIAAGVALDEVRPFDAASDVAAGLDEEAEWSSSWVEKSRENNSEWVQDLVVDERIAQRLRVYENKSYPAPTEE
ncbi:Tim54p [Dipodascopsis tothii]|uniref:Tim54p n=1 Tax=Dipodascopsis tothii TaxID=44089 RepID=UPI0034CEBDE0